MPDFREKLSPPEICFFFLVPNDVQNFILFGTQEINAASKQAAVYLLEAFEGLTDSVK